MELEIVGIIGFILASYSVVGNDVIQTLGTFISSNYKRNWWVLWLFSAGILSATLMAGWFFFDGDVTFGRLDKIPLPDELHWWLLIPPVALVIITQVGFPVSTTFLILSVFSSGQVIEKMLVKSVAGYAIAFLFALIVYLIIARKVEVKSKEVKLQLKGQRRFWMTAQWITTGFLWSQWLIQDFANIYVYLPRQLNIAELLLSLALILILLALVFKQKGGKVQEVVKHKFNTANIRSATLIDLCYGVVLFIFIQVSSIPMSTTWTFVGILAGREFAINYLIRHEKIQNTYRKIFTDLFKVNVGLVVSIAVALIIRWLV
jgi:hypothetical protein